MLIPWPSLDKSDSRKVRPGVSGGAVKCRATHSSLHEWSRCQADDDPGLRLPARLNGLVQIESGTFPRLSLSRPLPNAELRVVSEPVPRTRPVIVNLYALIRLQRQCVSTGLSSMTVDDRKAEASSSFLRRVNEDRQRSQVSEIVALRSVYVVVANLC